MSHKCLSGFAAAWCCCAALTAVAADGPVTFNRDIRPILSENCFACHGPDKNKRDSELRLDTREGAFVDLGGHVALVPGQTQQSEVYLRVTSTDPEKQMPPPASGKTLTPRQIDLLRRWIEQGAVWQDHWSYAPLVRPTLPAGAPMVDAVANPIDKFVRARLLDLEMAPAAEADRVTLIRRLSFDLVGLPPAPDEVAAFVADTSSDAYEKLVDKLLASPHYGERMAMYWLDLVRYADTTGIHGDNHRDVAPFRDYIIAAFNDNKPFDQFAIEQLAGDLLPEATLAQKVASGYNRMNMTTTEGGAQAKEYIAKYAADRVRNASTVWLGATLGCAECHDHKFDPYTTKDFYSFAAFFADVQEQAVALPGPPFPVPNAEQSAELTRLDAAIAAQRGVLDTQTPELTAAQPSWEVDTLALLTQLPQLSAWQSVGPFKAASFDEALNTAFPPEAGVDLAQTYQDGALKWTPQPDWVDGKPHELTGEFSATYLYRTLTTEAPVKIFLWLGSDDGLKVWLNGTEALSRRVERAVAPDQEKLALDLPAGESKLLIKIANGANLAGFYFQAAGIDLPANVAAALRLPAAERNADQQAELAAYHRSVSPLLQPERDKLAAIETQRAQVDGGVLRTLVAMSVEPRTMRVLPRGNWLDESGEVVQPGVPAFLNPYLSVAVQDRRANRLDLAQWLVARDNPLLTRVFVNRLWKLCFGRGLATPLDDLGSQGVQPTHLELLDWLAVELMDNGWNVKQLLKLLVMSETYRQSSHVDAAARSRDPFNLWLARQGRFRLDAEMIRDNALAVSGLLSRTIGGRSVKPYQPRGYWAHLNFPTREYEADHGESLYRRGLYTYWARTFLHPSLLAFDAPSREECAVERNRSNTPLQALVLLNDPTYVEAARVLAEHILRQAGDTPARLNWAFRQALSRDATAEEIQVLGALHAGHLAQYAAEPATADQLLSVGEWPAASDLSRPELAAWTSVARVILNLHETITRN